MSKKQFPNVNTPGFNFGTYLRVKYEGLFPEHMPTRKDLWLAKREIGQLYGEAKAKRYRKYLSALGRYNKIMSEWRKQQ